MRQLALALALVALPAGAFAQSPALPLSDRLTSEDPAIRGSAVDELLARPLTPVNPFGYALVATVLWGQGRRVQAAFWFYVFQARTRAWADLDTSGDGAAALRASLNDGLGGEINRWLGSDLTAWKDVATRAMSFEAHLPLGEERPDGVSGADWARAVAKARVSYRAGYDQTLGRLTASEMTAQRRENGLRVGPLDAPGPALPPEWR